LGYLKKTDICFVVEAKSSSYLNPISNKENNETTGVLIYYDFLFTPHSQVK